MTRAETTYALFEGYSKKPSPELTAERGRAFVKKRWAPRAYCFFLECVRRYMTNVSTKASPINTQLSGRVKNVA